MNIKFILRGTKEIRKIYVRVYQSDMDISQPTSLILNHKSWNKIKETSDNEEFNLNLQKLKISILDRFNSDYAIGVIIDKEWLKNVISVHFKRDSTEKNLSNSKSKIYLSDFCDFWLENEAKTWKVSPRKFMDEGLIGQYQRFVDILKSYEKSSEKIKLSEVTQDKLYNFVSFLEDQDYNSSTINRHITRLKFFCNRALELNVNVNKNFNQRIFIEKESDELESVYLNEEEIQRIYDLDLSHDYELDNVRDSFVMSCYLGLRVSDFMTNLKIDDIKNDIVSIKTQKTNTYIKIPVHKFVKEILNKRFGQLPSKMDASEYNRQIKILGQLAKIDDQVYGSLFDKDKKRKVKGFYKKFQILSSHSARKSLATNLHNKVPDEVIMSCMGWSSQTMVKFYNKTTKIDYANQLKDFWESKK